MKSMFRDDPGTDAWISSQRPVVLKNGSIVPISSWADMDQLLRKMVNTSVRVKCSTRDSIACFSLNNADSPYNLNQEKYGREVKMMFGEFVDASNKMATKRKSERDKRDEGNGYVFYCHESFNEHRELGSEFGSWDWSWILRQSQLQGWNLPDGNTLFMSCEGTSTPLHFDERHNYLNQVRGTKLVVLFPPDEYTKMYTFPVTHPCDRVSMVDVSAPNLEKFPKFAEAQGHVTVLMPGDLLYIPYGWFHGSLTLAHLSASITFWSKIGDSALSAFPEQMRDIPPMAWLCIRRNLEKVLLDDVGVLNLDKEVVRLLHLIDQEDSAADKDTRIVALKCLLGAVRVPDEDQLSFLADTFRGRFGFDCNACV